MATYKFELDGKQHSFTTDHELSDEELSSAIGQLSTPEATKASAAPAKSAAKEDPYEKSRDKNPTLDRILGDPEEGTGDFLKNLGNSIGANTARLAAGAGQLYEEGVNYLGSKLGVPEDKQTHVAAQIGDRATAVANDVARRDPLAAVAGATVPMAAGGAVTAPARAATAPGRIAQAAGAGALAGAAEPVPSGESVGQGKMRNMAEGGIIGGTVASLGEAGSAIKNKASQIIFGHTGGMNSPVRALADKAEQMGFKLSPQQKREDSGRLQTAGLGFADRENNTFVANRQASRATGEQTDRITSEYIGERYKDLGAQFDKIYEPGKQYKIDASVLPGLQEMVQGEANVGRPFASSPAIQAANKILTSFGVVQNASGLGKVTGMKVDAEDIQRLRDQVSKLAYKTQDPYKKDAMMEVVHAIDKSVEKNNPEVAEALKELRPKYRALSTLDTLSKSGGIDQNGNLSPAKLGEYLRKKDPNYTKDKSTHPLAELGELGETFGIRGMGEANIVGGGTTARARPEDIASHTGRIRMAMEHARDLPGVKQSLEQGYQNKIYSMTGYGLSQEDLRAINATQMAMQDEERKREATNR